jgi:hypothetical protein
MDLFLRAGGAWLAAWADKENEVSSKCFTWPPLAVICPRDFWTTWASSRKPQIHSSSMPCWRRASTRFRPIFMAGDGNSGGRLPAAAASSCREAPRTRTPSAARTSAPFQRTRIGRRCLRGKQLEITEIGLGLRRRRRRGRSSTSCSWFMVKQDSRRQWNSVSGKMS